MMNRLTAIAYIDVLTVLMAWFLIHANHQHPTEGNVTQKAEFVAILEWPESSTSDVDLWVRNPEGSITNFREKDVGLVSLDRDDLGNVGNLITGPDGKPIVATVRREEASVRAIIPGRFVVNVMLYALRDPPPIKAHVQIIKLNPYSVVAEREVELTTKGQERTIASFDVSADGSVAAVDTADEVSLAKVIP